MDNQKVTVGLVVLLFIIVIALAATWVSAGGPADSAYPPPYPGESYAPLVVKDYSQPTSTPTCHPDEPDCPPVKGTPTPGAHDE